MLINRYRACLCSSRTLLFSLSSKSILSNRKLSTLKGLGGGEGGHIQKMNWIAICQMTSTECKISNFSQAKKLTLEAKSKGATMVFMPECFDFVAESKHQSVAMAESLTDVTMKNYKELAHHNKIWLSLGGFHEKGPPEDVNRIYNSHVIINSDGEIVSVYRKTHLFNVDIKDSVTLKESDHTIPGKTIIAPVDSPVGKIGLEICYDVRFPEVSIILRRQGATILTYPSAFTVQTGMAHWEVLLRCRAIENQCYVVAAAQSGQHNSKRRSYGHSMVIDPWGTVIAQCSNGISMALAPIDNQLLQSIREGMPVLEHKRSDLYDVTTP